MSEKLSREIQKLDVRLERFVTEEEDFVKTLRNALTTFQALHQQLDRAQTEPDINMVKELVNLRLKAIEALSEALKKASDAEHEKSHLLESYGALILATEKAFNDV